MNKINDWFRENVDRKQLTTILVATAVTGAMVYGARQAGLGKVATVVKGG